MSDDFPDLSDQMNVGDLQSPPVEKIRASLRAAGGLETPAPRAEDAPPHWAADFDGNGEVDALRQQLAEAKAREGRLREALERIQREDYQPIDDSWTLAAAEIARAAITHPASGGGGT